MIIGWPSNNTTQHSPTAFSLHVGTVNVLAQCRLIIITLIGAEHISMYTSSGPSNAQCVVSMHNRRFNLVRNYGISWVVCVCVCGWGEKPQPVAILVCTDRFGMVLWVWGFQMFHLTSLMHNILESWINWLASSLCGWMGWVIFNRHSTRMKCVPLVRKHVSLKRYQIYITPYKYPASKRFHRYSITQK